MTGRSRILLVAVAALLCWNVAGAGARPQATISPTFIKKTDGLCATISTRFTHTLGKFPFPNFDPLHPDAKTLPLVGKHFAKALPIRHAIPGELRGLGQPGTGQTAWASIRSLALQSNAVAVKQVSAALASDSKAFVGTVNEIQRLHDALVAKATAAGFPKTSACGKVF